MSIRALTKGEQTRQKILDLAEDAVLAKGYAATSIDELIVAAGITKSGFFYHFKDKNELALALIRRFIERDEEFYLALKKRSAELSDDPLHEYLIYLKLMAEAFEDLPNGHPGCLAAACAYQENLFSREVSVLNEEAVRLWHTRYRAWLDRIAARYPPKIDVDLDALANMVSALADGGIVLSKALHDPMELPKQILAYRQFVRLIFLGQ